MSHYHLPHNHGQNIERVLERMPPSAAFQMTAATFQQLGDPTRLRILWLLCHSEECVCNIAAAVGMSDPAVSHHLRVCSKSFDKREGKADNKGKQAGDDGECINIQAISAGKSMKRYERI